MSRSSRFVILISLLCSALASTAFIITVSVFISVSSLADLRCDAMRCEYIHLSTRSMST